MRTGWSWAQTLVVAAGFFAIVPTAFAGGPLVGVELAPSFPTKKFRNSVDTGGSIAPYAGYEFGDTVRLGIIAQPQFAGFPIDHPRLNSSDDMEGIFSFTVGPRLSIGTEGKEGWVGGGGGVYTGIAGPLTETSGGWNVGGGVNIDLVPGTALGIFVRHDQAYMDAYPGLDRSLTYLSSGVSLQHRFNAPEPVVAAAAPPPPVAEPAPAPVMKKRIVLRGVNFDTDKWAIRNDARPILDEAVSTLKENSGVNVSVEGHTDSRASDAHNQTLSERRADSVANYMMKGGVEKSRLTTVGFGESKPVASNDTADGMQQNRRVELRILSE